MSIQKEYRLWKARWQQGGHLLWLRLQLLRLDVQGQLGDCIRIVVLAVAALVLLLVALLALLFGLNVILSPLAKIWVFFGLMAACLIAAIGLVWAIPMYWRRSHERVGQTLNDMQQDWVRIIGTNSESNHE